MERLTGENRMYYGDKVRQRCYLGAYNECPHIHCQGCPIMKLYRKLSEIEDRQETGCYWCKGKPNNKPLIDGNSKVWIDDTDGLWAKSENEILDSAAIKYCPMCGRRLPEEKESRG